MKYTPDELNEMRISYAIEQDEILGNKFSFWNLIYSATLPDDMIIYYHETKQQALEADTETLRQMEEAANIERYKIIAKILADPDEAEIELLGKVTAKHEAIYTVLQRRLREDEQTL